MDGRSGEKKKKAEAREVVVKAAQFILLKVEDDTELLWKTHTRPA